MPHENDLQQYFRNFFRGHKLEKTNPGLLDRLMQGLKIKQIGTHGLRDGANYRKKVRDLQQDYQLNDSKEM